MSHIRQEPREEFLPPTAERLATLSDAFIEKLKAEKSETARQKRTTPSELAAKFADPERESITRSFGAATTSIILKTAITTAFFAAFLNSLEIQNTPAPISKADSFVTPSP